MEINRAKLSPMMQKYFETKDQYPGCILFYRLGDFYEMFFDDAITASKALEITLTGGQNDPLPLPLVSDHPLQQLVFLYALNK